MDTIKSLLMIILTEDKEKQVFFKSNVPSSIDVMALSTIEELIFYIRFQNVDLIVIDKDHPEANQPHLINFIQNLSEQTLSFINAEIMESICEENDEIV